MCVSATTLVLPPVLLKGFGLDSDTSWLPDAETRAEIPIQAEILPTPSSELPRPLNFVRLSFPLPLV